MAWSRPQGRSTLTTPGTYYWQASYSGDPTNAASTSTCGSEVETVTSVTTTRSRCRPPSREAASRGIDLGAERERVHRSATLAGTDVATAGGTVTYTVYSNNTCTKPLTGAGRHRDGRRWRCRPTSDPVLLAARHLLLAGLLLRGSTNAASTSTCGSEVETVTSVTHAVTVTTSLSGGGQSGASISVPTGTSVSPIRHPGRNRRGAQRRNGDLHRVLERHLLHLGG